MVLLHIYINSVPVIEALNYTDQQKVPYYLFNINNGGYTIRYILDELKKVNIHIIY
jgi:hypothetical protein